MSSPSESERQVYAIEDLTESVEDLTDTMETWRRELQVFNDAVAHDEFTPASSQTLSDGRGEVSRDVEDLPPASYQDTLMRHMTKHGVPTHLVTFRDNEKYGDEVYFKEDWSSMDADDVEAFREYTMNQDHVDVYEWVERNGNTFPDGFVVDYESIEELRA